MLAVTSPRNICTSWLATSCCFDRCSCFHGADGFGASVVSQIISSIRLSVAQT